MVEPIMDEYQQRYIDYHKIRRQVSDDPPPRYTSKERLGFEKIMRGRRSQRVFNSTPLTSDEIFKLYGAANLAPSSCNRRGVSVVLFREKEMKEEIAKILVGGVGWLDTADSILFLLANMVAYKSPAEVAFMPYLDAGVIAQNVLLMAESLGIGACFVNPNILKDKMDDFVKFTGGRRFCGAIALGRYDYREVRKK